MEVEKLPLLRANGYAVSRDLNPKLVPVASCAPLGREIRKHPPGQVRKLANSLDRFGFVLPILIDMHGRVVAGWGLVLAARQMGLIEVPAVSLTDLSEAELDAAACAQPDKRRFHMGGCGARPRILRDSGTCTTNRSRGQWLPDG
jgi:hypothetical protein